MWCTLWLTIYEVYLLPRPPNRVRKCLCKVWTLKIQSHSLNKLRRVLFWNILERKYLESHNKPCVKIWGCGEVMWGSWGTSCTGWAKAKDHVMLFVSQTDWYEKDNEISSSHCNFFQLVILELNIYTLSPRNMKRPTPSHWLDATIIGTPHFT